VDVIPLPSNRPADWFYRGGRTVVLATVLSWSRFHRASSRTGCGLPYSSWRETSRSTRSPPSSRSLAYKDCPVIPAEAVVGSTKLWWHITVQSWAAQRPRKGSPRRLTRLPQLCKGIVLRCSVPSLNCPA
jgi:hypothetical protein